MQTKIFFFKECSIHVQCHFIPIYQTWQSLPTMSHVWNVLGLGNQNRTTFTTRSGKMSLRWLTCTCTDLSAVLSLSVYLSSRKTPRLKALSKKIYIFPFEKNYLFARATLFQLTTKSVYFVNLLCMVCRNNVSIHHNFHSRGYRMSFRSPDHHNLCPDKHSLL